MSYGIASPQAWTQAHAGNSAEQPAGALASAAMGIPGVLALTVPTQGAGANVDFTSCPYKIRVLDVWCVRTVGASPGAHTTTVQNGAAAITNAMNTNVADTAIVRASQINDANQDIAAGGTIRVVVSAASADMIVYVRHMRVA